MPKCWLTERITTQGKREKGEFLSLTTLLQYTKKTHNSVSYTGVIEYIGNFPE